MCPVTEEGMGRFKEYQRTRSMSGILSTERTARTKRRPNSQTLTGCRSTKRRQLSSAKEHRISREWPDTLGTRANTIQANLKGHETGGRSGSRMAHSTKKKVTAAKLNRESAQQSPKRNSSLSLTAEGRLNAPLKIEVRQWRID